MNLSKEFGSFGRFSSEFRLRQAFLDVALTRPESEWTMENDRAWQATSDFEMDYEVMPFIAVTRVLYVSSHCP